MKKTYVILAVLMFAVLIAGCGQKDYSSQYQSYNQPASGAVVGGGCSVGSMTDYESTPSVDASEGF